MTATTETTKKQNKPARKRVTAKKRTPKKGQKRAEEKSTPNLPEMSKASVQNPAPFYSVLGEVNWLMMQSKAHRHLFVTDAEWLVMPPVQLKQFRIVRSEGRPVAYVSWALLSEEVEQRLVSGVQRLAPTDWKSGNAPWLIDVVAPFGGQGEIVEQIRKTVFKEAPIKTLRPKADGTGLEAAILGESQTNETAQKD